MVVNRKPTGRAVSTPVGLSIGAAFAVVWTILGAMTAAKLVDGETIPESAIGYCSVLILLTASFGAALISYGKIKRQRALVCMASGMIYFLILMSATALFFGGQYTGMGVTALLILAGSGAALLLGLNSRGGKQNRIYKKHAV